MRPTTSETILDEIGRDEFKELLSIYTRLILSVDGLWFLGVERRYGIEKAIEIDEDVWRQFGQISGMRVGKFLSIDPADIHDICDAILLSPMFICMGGKAEISDGKAYLYVTDCLPQKARVRKGMGEFPCKSVGTAYFEGLIAGLNPALKFKCVVCPPGDHPADVWCKWELSLSQEAANG